MKISMISADKPIQNPEPKSWIERLDIPTRSSSGVFNSKFRCVNLDDVTSAFNQICGKYSTLSNCMAVTFDRIFWNMGCPVMSDGNGNFESVDWAIESCLCEMFGSDKESEDDE
jgi:hypothetical protein